MTYLLFSPRSPPQSWVQFSPHIDLQTNKIQQYLAKADQSSKAVFSLCSIPLDFFLQYKGWFCKQVILIYWAGIIL